jgi:hypothetical protein
MVLLVLALLALLTAVLRGGQFSRLAAIRIRSGWLILVAFAMQVWLVYFSTGKTGGAFDPSSWMHVGSYVLLMTALWQNRHLPGMPVIALGLLLNAAVITANGGFMPIEPDAVERIGHTSRVVEPQLGSRVLMAKDLVLPRNLTRLWLLSDVFVVALPYPFRTAFSLGDALLAAGIFVLLNRVMINGRTAEAEAAMPRA